MDPAQIASASPGLRKRQGNQNQDELQEQDHQQPNQSPEKAPSRKSSKRKQVKDLRITEDFEIDDYKSVAQLFLIFLQRINIEVERTTTTTKDGLTSRDAALLNSPIQWGRHAPTPVGAKPPHPPVE